MVSKIYLIGEREIALERNMIACVDRNAPRDGSEVWQLTGMYFSRCSEQFRLRVGFLIVFMTPDSLVLNTRLCPVRSGVILDVVCPQRRSQAA